MPTSAPSIVSASSKPHMSAVRTKRIAASPIPERIPKTAHGQNVLRVGGVVFQLAPQLRDMLVYCAGISCKVPAPNLVKQHCAPEGTPRVAHKVKQQIKLAWRKRDLNPISVHSAA